MNAGHLGAPTRLDAEGHQPGLRVPWHLVFTSRVTGWGLAATTASAGLILHDAVTARSALLIAGLAVMYWLGFAINDYFDAPSDAPDEYKARNNLFVRNHFDRRTLAGAVILLLAPELALFASFGPLGFAMYALATAAMWGYSAPPLPDQEPTGQRLVVLWCFWLRISLSGASRPDRSTALTC